MYTRQLEYLLSLPKIEQKSEEWYELRHNMITASDFAQALGQGKFGTQKQLIEKKCSSRGNETSISKSNPFFKWGNMFEPVACAIYSKMHKDIKIHDFGLIQHPKYTFFGASPDGITESGIMLEIKCPFKRKINGEVPKQYYYQIQGQLDVCDLDECDYFECMFDIVDKEIFIAYNGIKGYINEENDGRYIYSNVYENDYCKNDAVLENDRTKYWILKEYNTVRIKRDKCFVESKLQDLKEVWDKIIYYRKNENDFQIDILNKIQIETESSNTMKKKTNFEMNFDSYAFLD